MARRDPMWDIIANTFKYALRSAVGPAGLRLSEAERQRIQHEDDLEVLFRHLDKLERLITDVSDRMSAMENSTWVPWWLRK